MQKWSEKLRSFCTDLGLILLATFCYYPSLKGDFVFDDTEAIVKNTDLNIESDFLELFKHDFWGNDIGTNKSHKSYRPFTVTVYRILNNFRVYFNPQEIFKSQIKAYGSLVEENIILPPEGNKPNPWIYHVFNVILYCVLACQLLRTLDLMFRLSIFALPCQKAHKIAILATILFIIHPVHSESVSLSLISFPLSSLSPSLVFLLSFLFIPSTLFAPFLVYLDFL